MFINSKESEKALSLRSGGHYGGRITTGLWSQDWLGAAQGESCRVQRALGLTNKTQFISLWTVNNWGGGRTFLQQNKDGYNLEYNFKYLLIF